uniref:BTB domain-containing protein n=1 Tax=Strigamia maritima TaxID=126957 RepID=T1J062_STRMM
MEGQDVGILTNLYNSRNVETSEIVLECRDGNVIVHRNLITAGSDYFHAMFNHPNIENDSSMVSFDDTTVQVMNIVKKFVYGQELPTKVEITDDLIQETIIAADRMQIRGLFQRYWILFTTPITVDNFLNVWEMAEMFHQAETIENIRMFIFKNTKIILETGIVSIITLTQLKSVVECDLNRLTTNNLVDFVNFLMIWATSATTGEKTQRIQDVYTLIMKCNIVKRLPDQFLRSFLETNQLVIKSASINFLFSREATSRWLTVTKPEIRIFAFEITSGFRMLNNINRNTWVPIMPIDTRLENWFPAVSRTGALFYFNFSQNDKSKTRFVAFDANTGETYTQTQDSTMNILSSETANRKEIFFRRTNSSYSCFNFDLKKWRSVSFRNYINDCKCMLLATDKKYFFDVDERHIKIIDTRILKTYVTKQKLPGNWLTVKCKSLNRKSPRKLIFFQRCPSCLLVYETEKDSWSILLTPDITSDVFMYVSYDEDCLIFERTVSAYNVYSLKTMRKVVECIIPNNVGTSRFHIDVNVKMHSLGDA